MCFIFCKIWCEKALEKNWELGKGARTLQKTLKKIWNPTVRLQTDGNTVQENGKSVQEERANQNRAKENYWKF